MLRNYVNEHQNDWDEFASVLTYVYNNHIHRSTGTTPFDLVFSRPPPDFSLSHNERGVRKPSEEQREHCIEQLEATLQKVYDRLLKTQQRYKRDFDKRVRSANRNIRPGDYVYLDPTDGTTKGTKLGNHAFGPYRVLANCSATDVHCILPTINICKYITTNICINLRLIYDKILRLTWASNCPSALDSVVYNVYNWQSTAVVNVHSTVEGT